MLAHLKSGQAVRNCWPAYSQFFPSHCLNFRYHHLTQNILKKYPLMIYTLLSRNFIVQIYALFRKFETEHRICKLFPQFGMYVHMICVFYPFPFFIIVFFFFPPGICISLGRRVPPGEFLIPKAPSHCGGEPRFMIRVYTVSHDIVFI